MRGLLPKRLQITSVRMYRAHRFTFLCMVAMSLPPAVAPPANDRPDQKFTTRLFNRAYALDTKTGLDAYIRALEAEIARSKNEEVQGEAHKKDPLRNREPKNYIDKKLRKAMEETRKTAEALRERGGTDRGEMLTDLAIMADGIQGAFARVLPPNMDAFTAYRLQNRLRHPRVGLGLAGPSIVAAHGPIQASLNEKTSGSSFWHDPGAIAAKDL